MGAVALARSGPRTTVRSQKLTSSRLAEPSGSHSALPARPVRKMRCSAATAPTLAPISLTRSVTDLRVAADEARNVALGLAAPGFRHHGMGEFADGRVVGQRDRCVCCPAATSAP
jgi:hypothetical protein